MPESSALPDLSSAREAFLAFTDRCANGSAAYRLTPSAEPSAFGRCFGIFCRALCNQRFNEDERRAHAAAVRSAVREARRRYSTRPTDKPFRQLLAFSLSALSALDSLEADPLADLVEEQLPVDLRSELTRFGCLAGKPGSGNQAMFSAIFLLHARDALGQDVESKLSDWVELHLKHMNRFGFWGSERGMTHLQFQNGYHQYEIFEFLGVDNPRVHDAEASVRSLADATGHFAPYPGGGACYDYDAVFVLTPNGVIRDVETRGVLERTAAAIVSAQRADGGFAESLHVRPRSPANIGRFARHILSSAGQPPLFIERLRFGLALQRRAHDRIHTHWSVYSRRWNESDLWDSWFRMLTLARIQVALDPRQASRWGFLGYPGIGFHPSRSPGNR